MKYKYKEAFRIMFRFFPLYIIWKRRITQQFEKKYFEKVIRSNIKNVPFYRKYESIISDRFDFQHLPIIRKADVLGHESEMVSKKVCKRVLRRVETGGSTGCSLSLFRYWRDDLI